MKNFTPSDFVIAWHGADKAIGGSLANLEIVANTLANFDNSEPRTGGDQTEIGTLYTVAGGESLEHAPNFSTVNRRDPSVTPFGKDFGYVGTSDEELVRVFSILNTLALPDKWDSTPLDLLAAERDALAFVDAIPRENFLYRESGQAQFWGTHVSTEAPNVDGEDGQDWLTDALVSGVKRAQAETVVSHD